MHLDLLSIRQSGGKMSKRLGGTIGCKYKTSSWHLNYDYDCDYYDYDHDYYDYYYYGFPYGNNIGSTA